MRLLGYVVLASVGLALVRLFTTLALIALGGWLLWALIAYPTNTIAALLLLASATFVREQPVVAAALLISGGAVWHLARDAH